MNELEQQEYHDNYGTPDSVLLKEIRTAGFKPIGITIMLCEETFIFKTEQEAKDAADKYLPEGWWYGFLSFEKDHEQYLKDNYSSNDENAPIVYWFDKNFAPKNSL